MNTVTVRASKQYDILIGSGLLPTLGAEAKKLGKAQKVCVISETTVYPLYGAVAVESLKSAGFSVVSYVFPAGEESKNGQIFLDLLNFLAENQLTRLRHDRRSGRAAWWAIWRASPPQATCGASASFRFPQPCLPPWIPPWAAKQPH